MCFGMHCVDQWQRDCINLNRLEFVFWKTREDVLVGIIGTLAASMNQMNNSPTRAVNVKNGSHTYRSARAYTAIAETYRARTQR